ncbi:MAG: ammonium transporter [Burkholderiales bacterium]|nr:ammonium transporter [Burkholderiales bacterium]
MKKLIAALALFGALGFAGAPAMAQDKPAEAPAAEAPAAAPAAVAAAAPAAAPAEEAKKLDSGDTAFMLLATVLVTMMVIPGLALFYAGMVRSKNALSVLMQVFAVFSVMAVLWAVYGYSLAFTGDGKFIGTLDKLFLAGMTADSLKDTIPEYVFANFQLTFAAITPALIVGAYAERMKFSAVLLFMVAWLTVCYVPMAHMVWGGGWIGEMGAIDFAGGTVVHINAGIAGLVAAIVLGKRKGYGTVAMPPHNLTMTLIGASLLWVGWYGFNAGSALSAGGSAGLAMINTTLATAAAAATWMFLEWMVKGKPSLLGIATGAVAGLVAITPACGNAGPMGSIILGIAAGAISLWAVISLKRMLGYDDSLDVFGVHGIAGIVGAIGIGILAAPSFGGTGFGGDITSIGEQLTVQVISVAFTLVYTGVVSYVLLKVIDVIVGLRVSEEAETEGLDINEHGETAYNN